MRHALREWIRRLWGTLGRGRADADLELELRLHEEFAAEQGRARIGTRSQAMDALRDQRGLPRIDALITDVAFGWRQLNKHRTVSVVAILSLGLAIGATSAAVRLVDALILRPLPVAHPDRLFAVATTLAEDPSDYIDDFDYPTFRTYAETVGDSADVMLVGLTGRQPATLLDSDEPEMTFRQYVSGNVFGSLGLMPAVGRLIGPGDDQTPGGHPVVVLGHDFWRRRFGGDSSVVGRTIHVGGQPYEIIGVAPKGFTGTEPGMVTDLFLPAKMNVQALDSPGWSWFRIWLRPKAGISAEHVRQLLQVRYIADLRRQLQNLPSDTPRDRINAYLNQEVRLLPAGSGVSGTQKTFRRPLLILAVLAALVLLIACANVANLMTAQAMARAREMALRVSIGASRARLVQLVLVESALLAVAAAAVGAIFAAWSAPSIVGMLASTDRPVRVILELDWRSVVFGMALIVVVTLLFGLAPALRASAVQPIGSLKGDDRRASRRYTSVLIAAQMAFCAFLVFVAGLFVATFGRLATQPLGFVANRLLVVQTESRDRLPVATWKQLSDALRQVPGVESASVAGWVPLSGNRWRNAVRLPGEAFPADGPYFLDVAPGYFETMRIRMEDGRDFRSGDPPPRVNEQKQPVSGVGIVNEAFVRTYFAGQSPVGRRVIVRQTKDLESTMEIVGVVGDAAYFSVREPMHPTVYVPIDSRSNGALVVRTKADSFAPAASLRRQVVGAHPGVRVRAVEPVSGLVRQQMIRERLLAALSSFFAVVALVLAAVGLYGVLNYAVIRQRREIGIRMALGARAADVIRKITGRLFALTAAGSLAGLGAAVVFGHAIRALLFEVTETDPYALMLPLLLLSAAAACAALRPAIRAARIDPAQILRTE